MLYNICHRKTYLNQEKNFMRNSTNISLIQDQEKYKSIIFSVPIT